MKKQFRLKFYKNIRVMVLINALAFVYLNGSILEPLQLSAQQEIMWDQLKILGNNTPHIDDFLENKNIIGPNKTFKNAESNNYFDDLLEISGTLYARSMVTPTMANIKEIIKKMMARILFYEYKHLPFNDKKMLYEQNDFFAHASLNNIIEKYKTVLTKKNIGSEGLDSIINELKNSTEGYIASEETKLMEKYNKSAKKINNKKEVSDVDKINNISKEPIPQNPSMQLNQSFPLLDKYCENNQLSEFIKEQLDETKTTQEEKEKLKKIVLQLIEIYTKLHNAYSDTRSMIEKNADPTIMIEKTMGFIFYELYKRESEKRIALIKKKLKKSSDKLFEFHPFSYLINEYKKILESSGERNINNRVLHVKKVILLTFNDLYAIDNISQKLPTSQSSSENPNTPKISEFNKNPNEIDNLVQNKINNTQTNPQPKPSINLTNEQNEINNNSAKPQSYFKWLLAFFGLSYLGYKLYQWSKKSSSNL